MSKIHLMGATTCVLALMAAPSLARAQTASSSSADATSKPAPLPQQTSPETAATTAAQSADQVAPENAGEIVVTAQRRSERLVDVPIAVTAISGAKLEESGVTSTAQLGQVVPGLRLDLSGAFFQPTVRGVGSATAGVGLSSNVATYIDGVYRPSPFSTNFELADIESIQVLKGPQGTLFGRNATGGAILVVTEDPRFTPNAHGTLSYGRYNTFRGTVAASTGLTDKIALGLSAVYTRSNGYVKDINTGRNAGDYERYLLRGKLLFKPTEDISFLLTGERFDSRDNNVIAYTAFDSRTFARPYVVVPTDRGQFASDFEPRYRVKRNAVSLRSIFGLGGLTLTSITAYSDDKVPEQNIDFDATALPGLRVNVPFTEKTFTQEVTLASASHQRLTWLAGLYYFRDKGIQPHYDVSIGGAPSFNLFKVGVTTNAYAAFADATFAATDRLFLTLGGRYSTEKQDAFFQVFPPSPSTKRSEKFKGFTPRAVIRYEFAPRSNIYFSYNKGFKAGGFAPTTFDLTPFKNEKINAYEVGLKTARRWFTLETSAFYYDYTNLQIANYTSGVGVITNAAQSKIYGGDLQVTGEVTDRLTLLAGVAYTHSEYTSFPNATFYPGTGLPGDPVTVGTTDASGNPLVRTPKWTGTFTASYDQPVGTGSLRFFSNYYLTSGFNFDAPGQFHQKGYGLLSGRITYSPANKAYSVGVFGNNLTDKKYLTQVLPFSGAVLQTYGTPRTYGVELGFKF